MLPEELFDGGNQSLAPHSYLWLYCIVNSAAPTLEVTWTRNDSILYQDLPHIIHLSSSTDNTSTFILVVNNFQTSDDGVYQCMAEDDGDIALGYSLNLTGMVPNNNNSLELIIIFFKALMPDTGVLRISSRNADQYVSLNRSGVIVESRPPLFFFTTAIYNVRRYNEPLRAPFADPVFTFLDDGEPIEPIVRRSITLPAEGQAILQASIQTFHNDTLDDQDFGIHQCIIADPLNGSEWLLTFPLRRQQGEFL